jgi:hypothetical protein
MVGILIGNFLEREAKLFNKGAACSVEDRSLSESTL